MSAAPPVRWLTVAQAADLVGCTDPTIRLAINRRELAAVRLPNAKGLPSRSIRISSAALEEWTATFADSATYAEEKADERAHL